MVSQSSLPERDRTQTLQESLWQAGTEGEPLAICGGGTKAFYGRPVSGRRLTIEGHSGIIHYAPTELVVTVRGGTPLAALEERLAERGQMLGFEPPYFGEEATVGGMVAAGLSGPRRPWAGAVRDAVLGVRILNGRGEVLRFGGEVMKNVAGYDLFRLMAGSLGTLGILLEVSLKLLPQPTQSRTRVLELDPDRARNWLVEWTRKPLPFSATAYTEGRLYVRLSGSEAAVEEAEGRIGGEALNGGEAFWRDLREHRLPFFQGSGPLWRLSLPPAAPALGLSDPILEEWGGALRWIRTDASAEAVRAEAERVGGHATLFRGDALQVEPFPPLGAALTRIHRHLKQALDPYGLLNPGRMNPEF